jgi:hypothetical protein
LEKAKKRKKFETEKFANKKKKKKNPAHRVYGIGLPGK